MKIQHLAFDLAFELRNRAVLIVRDPFEAEEIVNAAIFCVASEFRRKNKRAALLDDLKKEQLFHEVERRSLNYKPKRRLKKRYFRK